MEDPYLLPTSRGFVKNPRGFLGLNKQTNNGTIRNDRPKTPGFKNPSYLHYKHGKSSKPQPFQILSVQKSWEQQPAEPSHGSLSGAIGIETWLKEYDQNKWTMLIPKEILGVDP